MTPGDIGILNVGAGDVKISFRSEDLAERIRAARIVKDLLRRGYALLVEVEDSKGNRSYTRVHEFREDTCCYIIADFDPVIAAKEDASNERNTVSTNEPAATPPDREGPTETPLPTPRLAGGRKRSGTREISASGASGIAISRSAGG